MAEFARIVCFTAAVVVNVLVISFLMIWLSRSVKRSERELRSRHQIGP